MVFVYSGPKSIFGHLFVFKMWLLFERDVAKTHIASEIFHKENFACLLILKQHILH